jgi:glycosyltransferase involved in cell wall biosynthesis
VQRNVCIIIPVYNESDTIGVVCNRVLGLPYVREIVAVDDASTDDTYLRLQALAANQADKRIKLYRHANNQGKTAAIVTALGHVESDIVVIQDADLEYDPNELEYLCQPIWDDNADVVYGSRFLVRRASHVLYFYHYLGNKAVTFFSNLFTNKNMSDIETCYKAFRSFLVTDMPISSRRFGFEVEVTAKVSKTHARIYETPISYHGRTYAQGKKITYRDGLAAFWYILRYNLFAGPAVREYVQRANKTLLHRIQIAHDPN